MDRRRIFMNLRGRRYGRLTVVGYVPGDATDRSVWRCVCDCGREVSLRGYALAQSFSCGCLKRRRDLSTAAAPPAGALSARQAAMVRSSLAYRERFGLAEKVHSGRPLTSAPAGGPPPIPMELDWSPDMMPSRFDGMAFGQVGPGGF